MTNQQQQEWFEQLHNRNLKASEVFMLPEFANVFRGVIDKYSDSAHFIYELLQNADDAGATNVSMVLEPDKFIFTHNGNTRFNISDPANVVHDRASGMLGHINSICYIGFSSKSGTGIESLKQNKIGKFGVGFKAVFQYTTTPEIYDNPFCFRIENYIVPCAISSEPYQKEGHTVIVIPFNRKDIDSKDSFSEIYHKLKNLNYPQLFLNNILSVSWNTPSENNVISKSLDDEGQSHGLQYRLYALSESKSEKKKILLLKKSLKVIDQGVHDIMIGYYLDKGRIVTKETRNIYCFFPTNENIETCYVIHAPFALVDNRQQIKRNNNINDFLFEAVAQLAASSLLVLRDWTGYDKMKLLGDNIIDIIKYNTLSIDNTYLKYGYIGKMFEKHYKSILDKESIFLSRNGIYLPKTSAWWTDKETRDLIDENQIRSLFKIPRIFIQPDFVLCSVNRTELDTSNIKISKFDGAEFSRRITSDFMKKQTIEWLARFYTYIKDKNLIRYYEINKGNKSTAPMRHANIVKVQSGEFVPAYNTSNELQVFYSTDANTNPKESVNTSLLESCAPFRELIKDLGVKTPNQLDKLKIKIAVHQQLSQKENNELLISIINYYNSCARAFQNEIIQLIKERYKFCTEDVNNKGRLWWVEPTKMYEDNQILKDYFIASGIDRRYFIYREFYAKAISTIGERAFNEFLLELGTKMRPEYSRGMVKLTESEVLHRQHNRVADKEISMIDGLDRIFMSTYNKLITEKLSHYIWDLLIYHCNRHSDFFDNNLSTYHLYNRDNVQDWGRSSLIDAIRKPAWLYINGERRSFAIGIYKEELSDNGYSYDGTLISKLKIESKPDIKEAKVISEMSKETREAFELGKEAKNFGLNSSGELALAMAKLHAYEAKEEAELAAIKERQARNERRKQDEDAFQNIPRRVLSKALRLQDLEAPDNERAKFSKNNTTQSSNNIDDILAGFEEKAKIQREEFEQVVNLRDKITQAEKYSYEWLTSLMQLEAQSQGTTGASGKKALYISFDRLSVNPQNNRMLILSEPSRYIPMSLEEMDSLPITFVFKNDTQAKLSFDSVSVKEDCLILKCSQNSTKEIDALEKNIKLLSHAFIEVNEPIGLITEWQNRVNNLPLNPKDSLRDTLRGDIEFIFGPPGTGKTTFISQRINDIIHAQDKSMKILVLAPTNKACDVLTRKLLELNTGNDSWIWRFEKTDDPFLEEEQLVYKRDCRISNQRKVCVISTMARYAFDGFEDGDLKDLEWDYVFIDEASMIPLYEVLPALYNSNSKRIIISGDPFQIEPIVNIDLWKGENIYTLISLNDFVNPKTEPIQFKVTNLMTQYRSIPTIGELFSHYLYGGKLSHFRKDDDHRILKMGVPESPLNIITFPVGKESIFDLKRLSHSNIQIYSVLFTVEFLKFISRNIKETFNGENIIKIGVISPYAAEIQAIQKIYTQCCEIYDNIEVIFGSAHGFQGDQCDIVIAVMNPPASGLKRIADMTFINNKNIINVAISRASDYLFLLIPEKEYEDFNSLFEIKKIGKKMMELSSMNYTSDQIEKEMFNEHMHIERNTYVTSHKSTNVFNNPFTKYEIRIDDNAIDIQINDL